MQMFYGNRSQISNKPPLLGNDRTIPLNTFIYLINEFVNTSQSQKKDTAVFKLAEEVGARIYEGMFFAKNTIDKKAYRKLNILQILKYIKDDLWETLFGKQAGGLEAFISDRTHSKTKKELKEYVLYEHDPIYLLKYAQDDDNFVFKFLGAMLKGFLCYAGFQCKVYTEVNNDKDRVKCEYIFAFDEEVFDTKG